MLRSLAGFLRRAVDRGQLSLDFDAPPRDAETLLARLRELGLVGIDRCRLTRNRTVLVSFKAGELRVHEGYLSAPPEVLGAIVRFVNARRKSERRAAQEILVRHPLVRDVRPPRARESTHPDDEPMAERLTRAHEEFNARHFGGALRPVPVRVSRRMRSRLGHYATRSPAGEPPEIVISRAHVRRHGWAEALHTLLHEMVHQWQDESGLPIDHGRDFRRKCREVGITARARRVVGRREDPARLPLAGD